MDGWQQRQKNDDHSRFIQTCTPFNTLRSYQDNAVLRYVQVQYYAHEYQREKIYFFLNIQALAIDEATFHTSKNSYYTKNKTSTSLPTSVLFLVKRSAQYQDLLKKNQYM